MKLKELVAAVHSTFPQIMAPGWCLGLLLRKVPKVLPFLSPTNPVTQTSLSELGLVPQGWGRT